MIPPLAARPGGCSWQITPEHARLVADTGEVTDVWPPLARSPTVAAYATSVTAVVVVVWSQL